MVYIRRRYGKTAVGRAAWMAYALLESEIKMVE